MKTSKLIMIVPVCCMLALQLNADQNTMLIDKANEAFSREDYSVALRFYERVISDDFQDGLVLYRYAVCLEETGSQYRWQYFRAFMLLREQEENSTLIEAAKERMFDWRDTKSPGNVVLALYADDVELALQSFDYSDFEHNMSNGNCRQAVIVAIERDHIEFIEHLLSQGFDPNTEAEYSVHFSDDSYETKYMLNIASGLNKSEAIELILEFGADPNTGGRWESGWSTALADMLIYNNRQGLQLLLDFGADVNDTMCQSYSTGDMSYGVCRTIVYAVSEKVPLDPEVLELLSNAGAVFSSEALSEKGRTYLLREQVSSSDNPFFRAFYPAGETDYMVRSLLLNHLNKPASLRILLENGGETDINALVVRSVDLEEYGDRSARCSAGTVLSWAYKLGAPAESIEILLSYGAIGTDSDFVDVDMRMAF